jgi:hypothetical protein
MNTVTSMTTSMTTFTAGNGQKCSINKQGQVINDEGMVAILYAPCYSSEIFDNGDNVNNLHFNLDEHFNVDKIKKQLDGNGGHQFKIEWLYPEQYVMFYDYNGFETFECVSTKPDDDDVVWVYLYPDDDTQVERVNKRNQENYAYAFLMYTSQLYENETKGERVCSFIQESTSEVATVHYVHGFLLDVIPYIAARNRFSSNVTGPIVFQVSHLSTGDDFVRYIYTGKLQIDADDVDEYRLRVESLKQLANFLLYKPLMDAISEYPDWSETLVVNNDSRRSLITALLST